MATASKVSKPQVWRQVTFVLHRLGRPPALPDACTEKEGEVLVMRALTPLAKKEDAVGNTLFCLEGEYLFRRLDDQFPIEVPKGLTFTS